ncbi:MAG TPA: VCBS repeat-containing protein, partial [Bacteroidia bacterium]|nr:VCBS repeat-containing protein [Bacteroidia bacterium]
MKKLIPLLLLFSATEISGQQQFFRYDSIPVSQNSQSCMFGWAGGVNFAQFSEIDLNQDGVMDLFVFDRTGNKISTYINNGTAGQVDYHYAPEYIP